MELLLPYRRSRPTTSLLIRWIIPIALIACSVSDAQVTRTWRNNETDRHALLKFKADVDDPHGVLSSWNSTIHFCQWYGVTCGRRHQRAIALSLQSHELSGTISPHVGNLSFLRVFSLQNNSFHSTIPPEMDRLTRLRSLYLNNNSLTGMIPPNITHCSNLIVISFQFNKLQGNLPVDLGVLPELEVLDLRVNLLSGEIPPSIGNLSSLNFLRFSSNLFEGAIPETLGNLRNLSFLELWGNNLAGNFPLWVTNLSSLETLELSDNHLTGSLPQDLGSSLPNIRFLSLENQLTGPIPESISNMSHLEVVQLGLNSFTGNVPSFREMSKLYWFDVGGNNLGSRKANDLGFLCSFTNSTFLMDLDIRDNNFGGLIPDCIHNLSVSTLEELDLNGNALSGVLPSGIWNFVNLEVLQLQGNGFTGAVPPEVGKLTKLKALHLGFCKFSGSIPHTLGNLTQMTHLSLRQNNISGTIPSTLGMSKSLLLLDLANNNLTGIIPPEIMSLSSLSIYADFSGNSLEGELPMEIGNLRNLGDLRLNGNRLSGEIPSTLAGCISLEALFMDVNMFNGSIPLALSSLKGMREFNLSHNRLSGRIPEFLEDLNLTILDLSFNDLEGNLPAGGVFANISATSIAGNKKLCGGLPDYHLPSCKVTSRSYHNRVRNVVIYTTSSILATVLALSLMYFLWRRIRGDSVASSSSNGGLTKVSYQDLLKATDSFSPANLIGTGSFGSVFRGVLPLDHQTTIAVKVLNLDRHGATRSFIAECEALRNIRHRNLVKVLTACSGLDYRGNDFKALVYEFMVNGNLDEWLHPRVEINGEPDNKKLNLLQRVDIAADVACALDYLHHQCETPIVHCDLKPSNVLIDGEMVAHVGDFGLVRFMPEATREMISDQTSSVGVKGSVGYIAPEYGSGVAVSVKGDVYSYGILVLEMFTGKRPTDEIFTDGLNLHSFAKAAFPERVLHIVDSILLEESLNEDGDGYIKRSRRSHESLLKVQECLASIVEIGVLCSSEVPKDRMSMKDVAAAVQTIRKKLHEVN